MSFYEVLMYVLNDNDRMELLNDSYYLNLAAAIEDIEERTGKTFNYEEIVNEINAVDCATLYPFVITKRHMEDA